MVIFFYVFAFLMLSASIMVVINKNPVHAVLWLIFAFCNAAGLMILIGVEFIAMTLIIVYVGAVAVLFLFVVMMLDIKNVKNKKTTLNRFFASVMALMLFADLAIIICISTQNISFNGGEILFYKGDSTRDIGEILYTQHFLPFQLTGIILFVAMISVITLILKKRDKLKSQNVNIQMKRDKKNSMTIAKYDGKDGLDNLQY